MFDKLKAAAGVAGLLKDLPKIKAKFEETKEELGRLQCTGHSACRHVRVVMNGRMETLSVDIDPAAVEMAATPEGRGRLQSAIVQACNDASAHARKEAATRVADVAEEMGLPVPRGLLSQL